MTCKLWIAKIINKVLKKKPTQLLHSANVFGARLNPPDKRDWKIEVPVAVTKSLPSSASVKEFIKEIKSQGLGNSCVAQSLVSCYEIMAGVQGHPHKDIELSEQFLWYEARSMRGWDNANTGTYPRDACKVMVEGCTMERLCPYNWLAFSQKPGMAAYWMRSLFKIREYYSCYDVESIKACLAGGIPVSITLPVSKIPKTQQSDGLHQVTICSYDDNIQQFELLNSWSNLWNGTGMFNLPYSTVEQYANQTTVIIPWFWK